MDAQMKVTTKEFLSAEERAKQAKNKLEAASSDMHVRDLAKQ